MQLKLQYCNVLLLKPNTTYNHQVWHSLWLQIEEWSNWNNEIMVINNYNNYLNMLWLDTLKANTPAFYKAIKMMYNYFITNLEWMELEFPLLADWWDVPLWHQQGGAASFWNWHSLLGPLCTYLLVLFFLT